MLVFLYKNRNETRVFCQFIWKKKIEERREARKNYVREDDLVEISRTYIFIEETFIKQYLYNASG